ncbi:MAG: polyprenyl synthetase family protein [Melioribacteraceae bacterium]|nr:polyprenyl synthetase family protein [Melioribacteraceae bacterium]
MKSTRNIQEIKIEKITKSVNAKLDNLFTKKKLKSLYDPCAYILKDGGKRLRPLLVLFSAESVNYNINNAYNAALAVELLHNFTLAHDDIMDNADKRRGVSTVHVKYDTNTAILAGDNLISYSYHLLLKDCSDKNCRAILDSFTTGIIEVCEGQSLDKEFEVRKDVTIDEYSEMIFKKTAAMIEMSCKVGGQLNNASPNYIKALSNYGKNLGLAFQLQDDLLDIIGDEKSFGKNIGGDVREGKRTFLLLRAYQLANKNEKILLNKVFNRKIDTAEGIEKVRNLFEKLGVINEAKNKINNYTLIAQKHLNKLPNKKGVETLFWLSEYLINRKK